jgi:FKBP-type peptidyl-prolyl cis-trans isomerase
MTRLLFLIPVAATAAMLAACGDGPDPAPLPTATVAVRTAAPATAAAGTPIVLENPTTTASGLKFVDQKVGDGATPAATSQVTVHYTGRLAANGQKFDSSVDRGQPATFAMNGVIPGFSEALSTMKVGGKRTAYIPSRLGYGPQGTRGIPPNADLVFEIELIAVK